MRLLSCLLLAGALLVSESAEIPRGTPIVTVAQGQLQGTVQNLLGGGSYFSFKGIPYARPPVGELRFRAPLPPVAWSGIRNASAHGPLCTQYVMGSGQILEGSEDCLFLNVYTRSLQPGAKIPVMVFIHGGAYMSGSGDDTIYGPDFLINHNVIMVTFNYRLEVLGFLALDTPEVPGNAGLKDQVFALRWVKENIAKFGGDPDNITIFGESAGSGSVTYQLLSPMSHGLFNKAIAHSGTALQDWSIARDMRERAFRIGQVLGLETTDTEELLDFLRSVPATDLCGMTFPTRTPDEVTRGLDMYFVPYAEKTFDNVEAFMTVEPLDALLSQNVNRVPLLIGYNSGEGIWALDGQLNKAEIYNANSSYLVPPELVPRLTAAQMANFGDRIMNFYIGDSGMGNDTLQEIVDLSTDLFFAYNIQRFTHYYSLLNVPVYKFRFNYDTEMNVFKNSLGLTTELHGACHADDLYYIFYNERNRDIYNGNEELRDSVIELTELWTNFAKLSYPTPPGARVHWARYSGERPRYVALDLQVTSGCHADRERIGFWNELYCEAGVPCIV